MLWYELRWVYVLVYLDDVVVFSRGGIERHVSGAAAVLKRLDQTGMALKPCKCTFGASSTEYLTHHLGQEGLRSLQRLVSAVEEFQSRRTRWR